MIKKLATIGLIWLSIWCWDSSQWKNDEVRNTNSMEIIWVQDATKNNIADCLMKNDEDINSLQEQKLQTMFYDQYVKEYSSLYWRKLHTNQELLCDDFIKQESLDTYYRVFQYFLRNWKQKLFVDAWKLWAEYKQKTLDWTEVITQVFADWWIYIKWEMVERIELQRTAWTRSGSIKRIWKEYWWDDEIVMMVENPWQGIDSTLDADILLPVQNAWWNPDIQAEYQWIIANEITHDILHKIFPELFLWNNSEKLSPSIASFQCEVPWLRFQNNAQANEFLSDVMDWNTGWKYGKHSRFFNPLLYMNWKWWIITERYNYSEKVQRYAMKDVLKKKWYKNSKKIVDNLIMIADTISYLTPRELLFKEARKYYQEDDFDEIAKIYRRIGVQLLHHIKRKEWKK
jgi:hypothetical protein